MSYQHKGIDTMIDLFEKATERHIDKKDGYNMEKDQPSHFSWVHIWCSYKGLATDTTTAVTYNDAEDFQQQIVNTVSNIFNTDTLQTIIDGDITMFGMQIGPEQPGGLNINEELGLEVQS